MNESEQGQKLFEEINRAFEPLQALMVDYWKEHPEEARNLRLAETLALAEGVASCPALAAHFGCSLALLRRMASLQALAMVSPPAFESIYQGLKPLLEGILTINFEAIESLDLPEEPA